MIRDCKVIKIMKSIIPPIIFGLLDNSTVLRRVRGLRQWRSCMKDKDKTCPYIQAIEDFAESRSQFYQTDDYKRHLYYFVIVTGIKDITKITRDDQWAYCNAVQNSPLNGNEKLCATTALYLFMAYLRKIEREEMPKRSVGRPPKTERNLAIFRLRERDPQRWTFSALAKKYGLGHKKTVWNIYQNVKKTKSILDE